MAKLNISDLDIAGKELAKLKIKKAEADKKAEEISKQVTEKQNKFIDLLLKADQDCWVIKGVGRLSLARRRFTNVVDYGKFVKWAATKTAQKYGMDMSLVEANTKVTINSKNGLGDIINEFKTDVLEKTRDVNFSDIIGVEFSSTTYITYSKNEKKK